MQIKIKYFLLFNLFLVISNSSNLYAQFYNGSEQSFGKSRVQYDEFIWQYYDYGRFQVYFYSEGNNLATYTAFQATQELDKLEKLFDFELRDKVQFVVYNKLAHFRQSNIGLSDDEVDQLGGFTRTAGSKIFLYFEGDHNKLNLQIREGLARIIISKMMYGGNWKEIIKNSTLLNLPEWYVKGLVSYTTYGWNVDIDSKVKDGILSGKFEKFNRLEGNDAVFAGHSMWNYIGEIYGENVIPNILYMSRISRSIESGFLFVIGVSLKTLSTDYLSYYRKKFETDESLRKDRPLEVALPIKSRKNRTYSQFKLSPNLDYTTFVSNQLGQYKIWLYDIENDKKKKIRKGEHKLNRIIDHSFPLITWHPSGKAFAYIIEKKGKIYLHIYDLKKRKKNVREIFELEKVLDMQYSHDGTKMIFSGMRKGQSDLFLYHFLGNNHIQLTNDPYDDLNPRFINNSTGVIFSSNRLKDSLNIDHNPYLLSNTFDLFSLDIGNSKPKVLKRITNTPDASETNPAEVETGNYTYLSDANGIVNRYTAKFDSTISHIDTTIHYRYFTKTNPNTNYSRNILEFDFNKKGNTTTELQFKNGKYWFYLNKFDTTNLAELSLTPYKALALEEPSMDSLEQVNPEDQNVTPDQQRFEQNQKLNIDNYIFEDEKPDYEKIVINLSDKGIETNQSKGVFTQSDSIPGNGKLEFKTPEQRIYYVNFATDYVNTQIDNKYLNAGYQRFQPGEYFNFPGVNGLLKMGISDLFEDYKISGAVRLSRNFRDNEYLLTYSDLSKRLDKTYIFHRQTENIIKINYPAKLVTNQVMYVLNWPFNEVMSLKGTLNGRYDREVIYSLERPSLKTPDILHFIGSGKLEFIFDNTIPRGINLYTGMRFKVFGEYYQELDKQNTDLMVFGFDVRHYKKVYRNLIWANRIAGSTSLGNQRLIYYMGGVDGWFRPTFDRDIPIPTNMTFGFQTIATPMRGHIQNVRNGNNFALFNTELRIPIFQFLINKPIKSDFVKNFQVIGFGDAGTAFTGWDPYSDENTFNKVIKVHKPLTITTKRQINPIVSGFGCGLRSRIWGYFIRLDWAWPIDDLVQNSDRIFYFSLSHDF